MARAAVSSVRPVSKKTGKRSVKPLDPEKDFNEPVKQEQIEEQDLLTDGSSEQQRALVENDMVCMQFVRVKPMKEKSGARWLVMELAVGLTDEAAELFGGEIEHGYKLLTNGVTGLDLDLKAHTLDIALISDGKPVIHQVVDPRRCSLENVQEKGSGEERTIKAMKKWCDHQILTDMSVGLNLIRFLRKHGIRARLFHCRRCDYFYFEIAAADKK